MSASDWLAAWLDSLEALQTPAVVGFTIIVGISAVRFAIGAIKGAWRHE